MSSEVVRIVERTRGIRYWIDGRIAAGWSNDQIEEALPLAVEFISGRMTMAELTSVLSGVPR